MIKRIEQFQAIGYDVIGAMFRRDSYAPQFVPHWNNVDLGMTKQFHYLLRVVLFVRAFWRLYRRRVTFRDVAFFYASNVDNAALAMIFRQASGSKAPLVYEVSDVHTKLLAPGVAGALFRRLEKLILSNCHLLVVSSPTFLREYFEPRLGYHGPSFVLENKIHRSSMPNSTIRGTFLEQVPYGANGRWVIGWFGLLDCQESWTILKRLATALPERVEIHLRGFPTLIDVDDFHAQCAAIPNITFGGVFRSPDERDDLHRMVDLIWAFDFKGKGANSTWLLPINLYEAGFYGKPVLARRRDTVGDFVVRHDLGWVFDDPVEEHLERFLSRLSLEEYLAKRQSVAAAPSSLFVETDDIERLCEAISR